MYQKCPTMTYNDLKVTVLQAVGFLLFKRN